MTAKQLVNKMNSERHSYLLVGMR